MYSHQRHNVAIHRIRFSIVPPSSSSQPICITSDEEMILVVRCRPCWERSDDMVQYDRTLLVPISLCILISVCPNQADAAVPVIPGYPWNQLHSPTYHEYVSRVDDDTVLVLLVVDILPHDHHLATFSSGIRYYNKIK